MEIKLVQSNSKIVHQQSNYNAPKSIFGSTTFKVQFTEFKFGSSNHNFSSLDSYSVHLNTHHNLKV